MDPKEEWRPARQSLRRSPCRLPACRRYPRVFEAFDACGRGAVLLEREAALGCWASSRPIGRHTRADEGPYWRTPRPIKCEPSLRPTIPTLGLAGKSADFWGCPESPLVEVPSLSNRAGAVRLRWRLYIENLVPVAKRTTRAFLAFLIRTEDFDQ